MDEQEFVNENDSRNVFNNQVLINTCHFLVRI